MPFKQILTVDDLIFSRMERWGLVYFDGTYFVCRAWGSQNGICSLITKNTYSYGTFTATAKVSADANFEWTCTAFPIFLECHHGWITEGFMGFYKEKASWKGGIAHMVATMFAGVSTFTDLGALDWTSDTNFKIEWISSPLSVKYYIANILLATHTDNGSTVRVPNIVAPIGIEVVQPLHSINENELQVSMKDLVITQT